MQLKTLQDFPYPVSVAAIREEAKKYIYLYARKMSVVASTGEGEACPMCKYTNPINCDCFAELDAQMQWIKEFFNLTEEEYDKAIEDGLWETDKPANVEKHYLKEDTKV